MALAGFSVCFGQEGARVRRQGNLRMSEHLHHQAQTAALGEEQRSTRMAKIMEANPAKRLHVDRPAADATAAPRGAPFPSARAAFGHFGHQSSEMPARNSGKHLLM